MSEPTPEDKQGAADQLSKFWEAASLLFDPLGISSKVLGKGLELVQPLIADVDPLGLKKKISEEAESSRERFITQTLTASGLKGADYADARKLLEAAAPKTSDSWWYIAANSVLYLAGYVLGIFKFIGEYSQPMVQTATRAVQANLPDAASMITARWRLGNKQVIDDVTARLGLSDKRLAEVERAMRPILDRQDLSRLRAIHDWEPYNLQAHLKELGYDTIGKDGKATSTGNRLLQLSRTILSPTEIFELQRRRVLDKGEMENMLALGGYDQDARVRVKHLIERLVGDYDLQQAYWRGELTQEEYLTHLNRLGYTPESAARLEKTGWILPTPTDLVRFGVREVFTPEIAERFGQFQDYPPDMTTWGNKVGLKEDVLKLYWAAHWDLPSPGQGFDMFHRGIITWEDLNYLLRALDVMPFWREKLLGISYHLVPRRTLARMVRLDVVDAAGAVARFRKLGFTAEDAALLTELEQKAQRVDKRDLTVAQLIDAYSLDVIDIGTLTHQLGSLGYGADDMMYFLARAELKKASWEAKLLAEAEAEEVSDARSLTKAEILRGYRDGLISSGEAFSLLTDLGYETNVANYLIGAESLRAQRELREEQAKQLRREFQAELVPPTQVVGRLMGFGYRQPEANRLMKLWQAEAKTTKAVNKAKRREPSRTDLNDWLVKGIIDVDSWVERMEDMGYDSEDVLNYYGELLVDNKLI